MAVSAQNPSASASSAFPHSFSIIGRNLKLDSTDDINPILEEMDKIEELREVHFGGNTIGVEAAQALAAALEKKKQLKVVPGPRPPRPSSPTTHQS